MFASSVVKNLQMEGEVSGGDTQQETNNETEMVVVVYCVHQN